MVDPSERCACHEEEDRSPHVFTSVLLGVLSCVLMTGGVFLAFHRWDPMWLMVSGVGVLLILIGTVLHCCNNPSRRPSGGKGCCQRPPTPLPGLAEQLLPLTNARSVSQLSLNMVPGYFPPVYGIEQHSAVVQNINRLVVQQQQSSGKSFIVLSLPGDDIQNLVATVCGSGSEDAGLRNAEVQTCAWPDTTQTDSCEGQPADADSQSGLADEQMDSPPPSYEDVALEGGTTYGTI